MRARRPTFQGAPDIKHTSQTNGPCSHSRGSKTRFSVSKKW